MYLPRSVAAAASQFGTPSFRALAALLLALHLVSLSIPQDAAAQPAVQEADDDTVEQAPLPAGLPKLPGPRDRSGKVVLKSENVAAFREVLIAPLAHWIETGKLALRVVASLDYSWSYGAAWNEASESNFRRLQLGEDGSLALTQGDAPEFGFPFGSAERIAEEKDVSRRARMILWNVAYAQVGSGDALYESVLSWLGSQSVQRESKGIFYRWFHHAAFAAPEWHPPEIPKELTAPKSATGAATPRPSPSATPVQLSFSGENDLLWQEVLQLFSPAVAFGYAHLTWRHRGAAEDLVWVHSPVTGSNRQVLASNRSDPLLGGVLTADDLLVWSTKIQSVNAKVLDEKVLLLPFVGATYYLAEPNDRTLTLAPVQGQLSTDPSALGGQTAIVEKGKGSGSLLTVRGFYQQPGGGPSMVVWNFHSNRQSTYAPWAPLSAVLIPRKVWILELTPRDPYYSTGREVLVVDKESMLPFYKVVYDTAGDYAKTVIGGWTMARTKDGAVRFPVLGFLLGIDRGSQSAMAVASNQVHISRGEQSKLSQVVRSLLLIENHQKDRAEKKPTPTPAAQPVAGETGEGVADPSADEAASDEASPVGAAEQAPTEAVPVPPPPALPDNKPKPGTLSDPEELDF